MRPPLRAVGEDGSTPFARWRGIGCAVTVSEDAPLRPCRDNLASHHVWMSQHWGRARSEVVLSPAGSGLVPPALTPASRLALVELEPWFFDDAVGGQFKLMQLGDYNSAKVEALMRAMVGEVDDGEHHDAVLGGLAIALSRSLASATGVLRARQDDAWINPNALRRVLNLMEHQLTGNVPVERLAAVAGLSPSAFLRAFRGSMGTTPGDYLAAVRIAKAEVLLRRTGVPVAWVARECGFNSAAHFSTTFKARRGCQPAALRRSVRSATPAVSPADT